MELRRWIFFKVALLLSVIFVSGCIQNHNVKQHQPFNKADYINYCNNGKKYFHQKAYTKAIDNYTKAIAIHPEPRLFTNRGAAFYSIGLYDMAIEDYERAIVMNPFDAKAYNNRGTAHYQKGEFQKAIADYDRSILLKPNYEMAQANRELVCKKRGECGKAGKPEVVKVFLEKKNYFKQGNKWFYKKKYDLAIEQYSQQISYRPDAKTYTNRGTAFYRKGMYDKAIEDYNHAIQLNPEDAKAYNNRGAAYFQKGNYAKASKDYQKAIQVDGSHTLAYDNQKSVRSIIFSQKSHPPKRFEYFAKAEAYQTKKDSLSASSVNSENIKIPPPSKKNNISTYIPPSLKFKNRPQFSDRSKGNFYTLHIASYQTRSHAEQDLNEIKRKLDKPVFIKTVDIPDKGRWYRVFVGQYKEKDQAFYSGEKLKSAGIIEYFSIQAS